MTNMRYGWNAGKLILKCWDVAPNVTPCFPSQVQIWSVHTWDCNLSKIQISSHTKGFWKGKVFLLIYLKDLYQGGGSKLLVAIGPGWQTFPLSSKQKCNSLQLRSRACLIVVNFYTTVIWGQEILHLKVQIRDKSCLATKLCIKFYTVYLQVKQFFCVSIGKFYTWLILFSQSAVVMVVSNIRCGAGDDKRCLLRERKCNTSQTL